MNKPDLPDSLNAFGRQLEDAVRRRQRRFARPPRLPRRTRRLTAGVGLAAAGAVAAAVAILLGSSATSPAYAVSQNGNGTVTVRWLRVSKINPANIVELNRRLHALGIKAKVVPVPRSAVRASGGGACPKLAPITLRPAKLKPGVKVTVDPTGRLGILPPGVLRVVGKPHPVEAKIATDTSSDRERALEHADEHARGVGALDDPGDHPDRVPVTIPPPPAFRKVPPNEIRLPHGAVVARCGPPPVVMAPPPGTATNGTATNGTATNGTGTTGTATATESGTATTSSTSADRGGN